MSDSEVGIAILGASLVFLGVAIGLSLPAYQAFREAIQRGDANERTLLVAIMILALSVGLASALDSMLASLVVFAEWGQLLVACWAIVFAQILAAAIELCLVAFLVQRA